MSTSPPKPTLDELIVSVSGRLTHQWDFAFYKNNGEIANRIRAELASLLKEISIDNDGDIVIKTHVEGSFYVTPAGIIAGGWLTNSKSLSVHQDIEDFAHIFELLAKSKGSFTVEAYNVRLFFRLTPENGLNLLRSRGFESVLQSILGDKTPSEVQSFRFSTRYNKGAFLDLLELEASAPDVQLRYIRDANGTSFDSYRAFLGAVNLREVVEDLKPFVEVLRAAEPRLIDRILGGKKQVK